MTKEVLLAHQWHHSLGLRFAETERALWDCRADMQAYEAERSELFRQWLRAERKIWCALCGTVEKQPEQVRLMLVERHSRTDEGHACGMVDATIVSPCAACTKRAGTCRLVDDPQFCYGCDVRYFRVEWHESRGEILMNVCRPRHDGPDVLERLPMDQTELMYPGIVTGPLAELAGLPPPVLNDHCPGVFRTFRPSER